MLKAIHAQEDREAARHKAEEAASKLEGQRLGKAVKLIGAGAEEPFSFYDFPASHWQCIRTITLLERLNREIRRRTRVVGGFSDGHPELMLAAARLRYLAVGN